MTGGIDVTHLVPRVADATGYSSDRYATMAQALATNLAGLMDFLPAAEEAAFERGREVGLADAIAALRDADTAGWPGGRASDVEGCRRAAIAAVHTLAGRPPAPQVHLRLRWRHIGGHIKVTVWAGADRYLTHAHSGELTFTQPEWDAFQLMLGDRAEILAHNDPLPEPPSTGDAP